MMARKFSGQRLRAARTAANISQERLAVSIGRSPQAVYFYERERSVPGGTALVRIVDTLGCSLDDLFEEDRGTR